VLLVLPSATYRAADFVAAAQRLDVELVVGSDEAQTLLDPAGPRSLVLNLRRPDVAAAAIALHAEQFGLDAVVAVDDHGLLAATIAAERLGLPHNPDRAAAATRDKAAMREAFARAGLPQPVYRLIVGDEDAGSAAEAAGFPAVLKPTCLSGSRGVIRVDDRTQALAAASRIRRILGEAGEDRRAVLLAERFVPGAEIAVEGLLRGGVFETLAVFDKPDPLDGPYFEETLYVTPSRLPATVLGNVSRLTAKAAAALGLTEGPVHAEFRVDAGMLTILELAARSIGGLCARSLRFGMGMSLEELLLRHALGLPIDDLRREHAASGVMMIPIPRRGRLESVDGLELAQSVPGVTGLEITAVIGKQVVPLPDSDRYLGFVFARGFSPEEVEDALRRAHRCLDITIR
jgi:biotin carboxylase